MRGARVITGVLTAAGVAVGAAAPAQAAEAPAFRPGVEFRLTGVLPDGTVRAGTQVDVERVDTAGGAPVTGDPAPEAQWSWDVANDDYIVRRAYEGPITVTGERLTLDLAWRNDAGRVSRQLTAIVRRAPQLLRHQALGAAEVGRELVLGHTGRFGFGPPPQGPVVGLGVRGVPAPASTIQWQRCSADACADIAGATGERYVVQAADQGATLRPVVRAVNDEGAAEDVGAASAVVQAPPAQPQPQPRVVVEGPGFEPRPPAPPAARPAAPPAGVRSADGAVRCLVRGTTLRCAVRATGRILRLGPATARLVRGRLGGPPLPVLAPGRTLTLGALRCAAKSARTIVCRSPRHRVILASGRLELRSSATSRGR
ncbi:MAG TPA: hypothetical protein VD931_13295 [Baekduia sp.]|nr:hypothetical protein [Baekduia sp.]